LSTLTQLTVLGLANGAVLALVALGFVVIYKATGVVNFAQGELLMVGAYLVAAFLDVPGLHWVLALVLAALAAATLGIAIQVLVLRWLVGRGAVSVIMITIGLAACLRSAVQLIWGTVGQDMPANLPGTAVQFRGLGLPNAIVLPSTQLWAVVLAAAALVAFAVFFQCSRQGLAMRVVAEDQQVAMLMGISVRWVFALAWALAAVSALVGGLLVANISGVSIDLADFGLLVFPVVILGGLESIPGTVVGGVVVGLLSAYASGYLQGQVLGLSLGAAHDVLPFVVLVLILLVKPYGLFGQAQIKRM